MRARSQNYLRHVSSNPIRTMRLGTRGVNCGRCVVCGRTLKERCCSIQRRFPGRGHCRVLGQQTPRLTVGARSRGSHPRRRRMTNHRGNHRRERAGNRTSRLTLRNNRGGNSRNTKKRKPKRRGFSKSERRQKELNGSKRFLRCPCRGKAAQKREARIKRTRKGAKDCRKLLGCLFQGSPRRGKRKVEARTGNSKYHRLGPSLRYQDCLNLPRERMARDIRAVIPFKGVFIE